ncbi:UTP--glucose-1-phosphate uridylyltransferase AglF [Halocatena marina]|uniref:UTP--glucose-1-phosphate uridylyltransferase AglF n=1 Tax=Halocatena marina TaxID=2934937 RepID=A0ABD5YH70_9EURY|nr:UTP--glucose-1-phosphate uridylyltransferase AglF [Halocatena marina]
MDAVILAAGKGTRLRPLTDDKPKGMVEVDDKPILTHCFEQLAAIGVDAFVVVVGYRKQDIIDHYGDAFDGIPITYTHQREQNGLAHALLTVENQIDDDFVLMLGDNIFQANLQDVVTQQQTTNADAVFLTEEVPYEQANRYGVCVTNGDNEITNVIEKPEEPPSNTVMTGFYTFSPAIFHACHLVQPSNRGEYEISEAIDLLIHSGRTIEAVTMNGWRVDVGYPEDRDRAERLLEPDTQCEDNI